jgi:shikimate 5-dehydrogenase
MDAPAITGRTRMLGLIADPIAKTRSPFMANALLQQRGQFGSFVLLPMQIPAEALSHVIAALRSIQNFAGAIVSMPAQDRDCAAAG